MRDRSANPNIHIEVPENDDSRQVFLSVTGNRGHGGGIAFNRLSEDVEHGENDPAATEEEEKLQRKEAPAAAAENVSGVRKMLLNPAEEALDSARQTAELIMKDALEALQRTKQRLMEVLPHSLVAPLSNATPAAEKALKAVEEAKEQILAKSKAVSEVTVNATEPDNQENEKPAEELSSNQSKSIISEPAMGLIHPLRPPSSLSTETLVQSRL